MIQFIESDVICPTRCNSFTIFIFVTIVRENYILLKWCDFGGLQILLNIFGSLFHCLTQLSNCALVRKVLERSFATNRSIYQSQSKYKSQRLRLKLSLDARTWIPDASLSNCELVLVQYFTDFCCRILLKKQLFIIFSISKFFC